MKKQNLKKLFAGVCAAAMMLALAACGTKAADPTTAPTTDPAGSSAQPTQTGSMPKIGILQYATHASLYNCYTGIVQGLEEAGYIDGETCTIQYVDGQGVGENNDMAAASFVNDGYDIIIAIATPAAMSAYAAAKDAGIPCYGSEEEQVLRYGCVASETLDYIALGRTTGQMAADVLNGADIATMPIALVTDTEPVYSSANMAKFDLTLPDAYADAREMVEA